MDASNIPFLTLCSIVGIYAFIVLTRMRVAELMAARATAPDKEIPI